MKERPIKQKKYLQNLEQNIKNENIPLHIAAKVGNIEIIELLLNLGSDIEAKNIPNQTPICLAIRYGNLSAFNYLLNKGASLNVKDSEGRTPLQIACIGKNKNGLKILSKLIELEKEKTLLKNQYRNAIESHQHGAIKKHTIY